MKIIESFYGSESLLKICPDSCRPQIVARIRVEVAGKILAAESRHDNWAGSPPYSHVMLMYLWGFTSAIVLLAAAYGMAQWSVKHG